MYMYICPTMCIHIHTDRDTYTQRRMRICVYINMYVCICTCTYTAACRKDLINEGIGRARWLAPVLPARFGRPRRADHEVRSSRPAWPIWCNSVLNATDNPGGGGSSESSKAPLPSILGERPRLPLQKKKRKRESSGKIQGRTQIKFMRSSLEIREKSLKQD